MPEWLWSSRGKVGYVANGAADPDARLEVAVTVGEDDIIHKIVVAWGGDSAWTYTVTYGGLNTKAAPKAPANARPLNGLRHRTGPARRQPGLRVS